MLRSVVALFLIVAAFGSAGAYSVFLPDDCVSPANELEGSEDDNCPRTCLLCACCFRQPPTVAEAAPSLVAVLLPEGVCPGDSSNLPSPLPSEILHVPRLS
jgi:hypothetical protein